MQQLLDGLVAVYRDNVQPRMRELPVYNAMLQVEARGFAPRDGHCSGILITPWCMNLVLLPGEGDRWSELAPGSRVEVVFPAATYALTLSLPAGMQPHLSLALFSTVLDFADQDTAQQVADEVLQLLYQADAEDECADPVSAELDRAGSRRPLSRRDLLRGRWLPAGDREREI
jgi:[NiFe] hydrogenase assembly HybE family chaperone